MLPQATELIAVLWHNLCRKVLIKKKKLVSEAAFTEHYYLFVTKS